MANDDKQNGNLLSKIAPIAGVANPALGAAVAIGGAALGLHKSAKQNKEADALVQKQRDYNKRWYDYKMAEDYTQRTDAQNILNKQREMLNEQYKNARATNVVAGGTDEALALQQEAAAKSLADTTGNIAAQAASGKAAAEQQYIAQDNAIANQQINRKYQQGANTAQATGQLVNSGLGLVENGIETLIKSKV